MSTGVTVTDTATPFQLGFDRIRSAGAGMVRVLIYWRQVAPTKEPDSWNPADPADSHYNWSYFDQQVQMARNAGLQPMIELFSAPDWAERGKASNANAYPGIYDPDPTDFSRFALAAAKRYSGNFGGLPRVRYWQAWNEPNLSISFQPQFKHGKPASPILYRQLLNRFAGAVQSVNPSNKVIGGGLAPNGVPGSVAPMTFARQLLCMTGRSHPKAKRGCSGRGRFDIWGTNPFTTGGPTHKSYSADSVGLRELPNLRRLIGAANRAGKVVSRQGSIPLWVTEFSWDSKPSDPGGVPMRILTRWTSEAMYRAWQAGVSRFFWLTLRDWPRPDGVPWNQTIDSGLYFRGSTIEKDRPKQNLQAFRFPFVAFPGRKGITIWGRTSSSTGGKVTIDYKQGKKWKRIGKVRAGGNGVFSSVVRSGFARRLAKRKRGMIRAVYRGESSRAFSLRPQRDFRQPPFGK
ncbi:MAG: hypothetical protein KDB66_03295 [Solirubrobacterales bacterium]|nr:hypothetical protein [Solirubrobacterales bacterium]